MKFRFSIDIAKNLIFALLYFTIFIGFFTGYMDVPNSVLYLGDILCLNCFFILSPCFWKKIKNTEITKGFYILFVLVIIGTLSAFCDGFHLILWIWALRNWGRLFLFLAICVLKVEKVDIDKTIDFLMSFFHFNVILVIVQKNAFKSLSQDMTNGFYGRTTSCVHIIMLLVILVLVYSQYFSKRCSLKKVIIYIIEIGICSVLAELKVMLFFMAFLLVIYMIVNGRFDKSTLIKYICIGIGMLVFLFLVSAWIGKIYPHFKGFFSITRLIADSQAEGGYGHHGYIDRLSAITVINKYFFNDMGWKYKLFGMGIGNAEYSSVVALRSDFYQRYGQTFSYLNFTSADLYLEIGFVGLILYGAFYLRIIISNIKNVRNSMRKKDIISIYYQNVGIGMAFVSCVFIIYNNLQRTDVAFILAFFLSIPFVEAKRKEA